MLIADIVYAGTKGNGFPAAVNIRLSYKETGLNVTRRFKDGT
jgi:hypothetical protein